MPKLCVLNSSARNSDLHLISRNLRQESRNALNSIRKFNRENSEGFHNRLKSENLSNQDYANLIAQSETIKWKNEFGAQYSERKVETLPADVLGNLAKT